MDLQGERVGIGARQHGLWSGWRSDPFAQGLNRLDSLRSLLARCFPLGTRWGEGPLAPIARRYAFVAPVLAVLGTVSSLLEGLGITLLIPLISYLGADSSQGVLTGFGRHFLPLVELVAPPYRLEFLASVLVGLIALRSGLQVFIAWRITRIDQQIGFAVRSVLARRLMALDYAFFLGHDSARLLKILSVDAWYGLHVVRAGLEMLTAGLALLVFCIFLFVLDARLFVLVVGAALVIRVFQNRLERTVQRLGQRSTVINEQLYQSMLFVVGHARTLRLFRTAGLEQDRFDAKSADVSHVMEREAFWTGMSRPLIEVLLALLFVATLIFAHGWGIALAPIAAFLILLYRCQPYLTQFARARMEIAANRESQAEIEWLLRQQPPPERARALPLPGIGLPIVFDAVTMRYPNGTIALAEASFTIRPGVTTALIGRSGAGKSTVVNLLCRLLVPESGRILLGGTPLADYRQDDWQRHVALAGQDVALVGGTVAFNIAYGRPESPRAEVEAAARAAHAHDFIMGLPQGYDTPLGDHGMDLSGGQRQRIGIARALLCRPQLLVLDEATSAVDALSEAEILKVLGERAWFHTALVISHRWQTLLGCEEGVVLEKGRVVEQGPLGQLAYLAQGTADEG